MGLWWWTAFPDDVTFDGEFLRFVPFFRREAEIIGREVDKVIITFATDVDAMTVALVLGRHGADEFPFGIEDKDAAGAALVRDIDKPLAVNGNSVRGVTVMMAIRKLTPIMMALELECSVTDDWGGGGLGGLKKEVGCAQGGGGGGEGGVAEECAAVHEMERGGCDEAQETDWDIMWRKFVWGKCRVSERTLGMVTASFRFARVAIIEKNKVACASGGAFCRVGCDPTRVGGVPRPEYLSL